MRRPARIALILLMAAAAARAGLFGRDAVASRWTAAPVKVNGDDADWDSASALEIDGISVQARNDAIDLYVMVSAHTRDGREQLTGEAGENVTLWFVAADGKTRQWGALLPFSHRSALTAALREPAGVDPQPELARSWGATVSTETWPAELPNRLAISARRPVWELKIPLSRLAVRPDRTVAMDFVVAGGAARPAPRLEERRRAAPPPGPPEGVALFLNVRLAAPPKGD